MFTTKFNASDVINSSPFQVSMRIEIGKNNVLKPRTSNFITSYCHTIVVNSKLQFLYQPITAQHWILSCKVVLWLFSLVIFFWHRTIIGRCNRMKLEVLCMLETLPLSLDNAQVQSHCNIYAQFSAYQRTHCYFRIF